MSKARIGFVGIGLMGHGIAKNLVTKGLPAGGSRQSQPQAARGPAGGGREGGRDQRRRRTRRRHRVPVRDGRAAGRGDRQRQGRHRVGRAEGAHRRRHVDQRTGTTTKMREELAAKGVRFVDAPLARTPVEAEQGRLNIMVGADDATFAELKPVLAAFCENIIHAGPPGHGIVLKLINNFIAQAIATATAEALRRRREVGAFDQEAARGDLGRRGQFRHLPDDGRQDAREQRRPHRPQVHAGQRDEGPALLHALRGVAAGLRDRRRSRPPEPRQREPAGLRRQVRRVADRGAGEAQRHHDRATR